MITAFRNIDRLSWFNRASGVYLLIAVPLYFNYQAYDSTLWEKFLVAHIIAIRMVAGWMGAAWTDRTSRTRGWLDLPILLYLGIAAISWLSAINPLKSGMEVVRVFLAAAIYFSVSRTYRPEYRDTWLNSASIALAAVSIPGILQYLGLGFLEWRSAGLPSSTFFYRNYAAMFVAIVLPLVLCSVVLARDSSLRYLHAASGTLGAIYLIYTRTRGAWMGVGCAVIAVGLALYLTRVETKGWATWSGGLKKIWRTLAICAAVIACASLASPAPKGELQTIPLGKESAASAVLSILAGQSSGRQVAWLPSLQMIADRPIFGVGIGNWDAEYLRYAGAVLDQHGGLFGRPHNDYLWVVAEMGLPGLIVFLWIIGGAVWLVWDRLLKGLTGEAAVLQTALVAGLIAISVHALFSFPRERMAATVIPYMFLGWIGALAPSEECSSGPLPDRIWRPALALVLVTITLIPPIRVTRAYRAYFWADVYKTFDRYEDTIIAIDAAIDFGVIDYRFYELKALAHHRLGDAESALEASQDLIRFHPYNPWSFHKVGLFQMERGNFAAARDAFAKGLEYGPGLGRIRRDLGQSYEGLGQPDSARATYEAARRNIGADALLLTRLAGLLAATGDYEGAQENIQIAVNQAVQWEKAHPDIAVVGDVAMAAQAYGDAIRAYERAAILVPTNPTYLSKLANALERGGQTERAIEVLRRLLNVAKSEGDLERIRTHIERLQAGTTGG